MTVSVGITIPAYRPRVEVLSAYVSRLDERCNPARIHIEVDNPTEQTLDRLNQLPVTVGVAPERRGKGAAITTGFESLETDILVFVDADGSSPAESVDAIIEAIRDEHADLAIGSRRHPDAIVEGQQTIVRRRMGTAFAWLARRLLSPTFFDYQCGAKALSQDGWQRVRTHLRESGFAWDIELLALADALEFRIVEVPIRWTDTPGSTVSPLLTPISLLQRLLIARSRAQALRGSRIHTFIWSTWEPNSPLINSSPEMYTNSVEEGRSQ